MFSTQMMSAASTAQFEKADYYVAPWGNDADTGGFNDPYATLSQAHSVASAGDLIYFRGGTYLLTGSNFFMTANGTAGNLIRYWAYPGETPIFDCSGKSATSSSVVLRASYNHFKGLTFRDQATNQATFTIQGNGASAAANNNIVENCVVHNSTSVGFQIYGINYPAGHNNNLFLNCDSYDNFDAPAGENSDGFAIGQDCGTGNIVRGCRAWGNSDDGFDTWNAGEAVTFEDCWSFYNGRGTGGDGNGWKLGKDFDTAPADNHVLTNCLAVGNFADGFNDNANSEAMDFNNCTAYNNGDRGFQLNIGTGAHTLDGCLSYGNATADALGSATATNCSWTTPPTATVTDADFENVTEPEQLYASREPGGGLPGRTYLQLVAGSDLRGTDIGGSGIDYIGTRDYYGGNDAEIADIYVAPDTANTAPGVQAEGHDGTGDGSFDLPYATWNQAESVASAGNLVYFRGGTYVVPDGQININVDGSAGNHIRYFNFPREVPVHDGSSKTTGNEIYRIWASYIHVKGMHFADCAVGLGIVGTVASASDLSANNIYEKCVFRGNEGIGLQISGQGRAQSGGAENNLILYCDAYDNWDTATNGENADGFQITNGLGTGNQLIGCRSFRNSDDGFDLWEASERVDLIDCWAFDNGRGSAGDGNGFKLGRDYATTPNDDHVLRNCIAAVNAVGLGFDDNANAQAMDIDNCTSFGNATSGWILDEAASSHTIDSCITFDNPTADDVSQATSTNNSWSGGVTLSGEDIESSRQNICLQSEDFSTTWSAVGVTVTANNTTAPDGATTADHLDNVDGSSDRMDQTVSLAANTDYTYSVYVQNDDVPQTTGNGPTLRVDDADATNHRAVWDFDGPGGDPATGTSGNATHVLTEDVGGGWFRLGMTFTTGATAGNATVRLYPNDGGLANEAIWAWGAMLHLGQEVGAYAKTEAAASPDPETQLTQDRKPNGDLPQITFLRLVSGSDLKGAGTGSTDVGARAFK